MYDSWRTDQCGIEGASCGSGIAPLFYIFFNMIVSNVMLNLFILVIIQQFSKYYLEDDNPLTRFEDDFIDFKVAWQQSSTDAYQSVKIKVKHIPKMFRKLSPRMKGLLGVTDTSSENEINKIIL